MFDGGRAAELFVAWSQTMPKDIGATTRSALESKPHLVPISYFEGLPEMRTADFTAGGKAVFARSPQNEANGSLMRNGAIAAAMVVQSCSIY